MINRLLLVLTVSVALLLILLVLLAPQAQAKLPGPVPLLRLFAEDIPVRRAAIACAVGLFVTAMVFFRRPRGWKEEQERQARRARTRRTIGA